MNLWFTIRWRIALIHIHCTGLHGMGDAALSWTLNSGWDVTAGDVVIVLLFSRINVRHNAIVCRTSKKKTVVWICGWASLADGYSAFLLPIGSMDVITSKASPHITNCSLVLLKKNKKKKRKRMTKEKNDFTSAGQRTQRRSPAPYGVPVVILLCASFLVYCVHKNVARVQWNIMFHSIVHSGEIYRYIALVRSLRTPTWSLLLMLE